MGKKSRRVSRARCCERREEARSEHARAPRAGRFVSAAHAYIRVLRSCILLGGELWIDESKLYPGDYTRGEPGGSDKRVWSETGCTCVPNHRHTRPTRLIAPRAKRVTSCPSRRPACRGRPARRIAGLCPWHGPRRGRLFSPAAVLIAVACAEGDYGCAREDEDEEPHLPQGTLAARGLRKWKKNLRGDAAQRVSLWVSSFPARTPRRVPRSAVPARSSIRNAGRRRRLFRSSGAWRPASARGHS